MKQTYFLVYFLFLLKMEIGNDRSKENPLFFFWKESGPTYLPTNLNEMSMYMKVELAVES